VWATKWLGLLAPRGSRGRSSREGGCGDRVGGVCIRSTYLPLQGDLGLPLTTWRHIDYRSRCSERLLGGCPAPEPGGNAGGRNAGARGSEMGRLQPRGRSTEPIAMLRGGGGQGLHARARRAPVCGGRSAGPRRGVEIPARAVRGGTPLAARGAPARGGEETSEVDNRAVPAKIPPIRAVSRPTPPRPLPVPVAEAATSDPLPTPPAPCAPSPAPARPPSRAASMRDATHKSAAPAPSPSAAAPRKLRLLGLHGWRTSAAVLSRQLELARWDVALGDLVEVVPIDAPHKASGPTSPDVELFFGKQQVRGRGPASPAPPAPVPAAQGALARTAGATPPPPPSWPPRSTTSGGTRRRSTGSTTSRGSTSRGRTWRRS